MLIVFLLLYPPIKQTTRQFEAVWNEWDIGSRSLNHSAQRMHDSKIGVQVYPVQNGKGVRLAAAKLPPSCA